MRGLQQALRSAQSELGSYANNTYTAKLGVDDTGVQSTVSRVSSSLNAFSGRNYKATLGADVRSVQQSIRSVRSELSSFAGRSYTANLNVRDSASPTIDRIKRDVSDLDGRTANIEMESRGGPATSAVLAAVSRQVSSLDGQTVRIAISLGAGAAANAALQALGSRLDLLGRSAQAVKALILPLGLAIGPALGGAALASVTGITALAGAIGSGLVGAAVAGTGALGQLAAGFGLVAAPIALLLGHLKEYSQSLDGTKANEQALQAAQQGASDAARTLAQTRVQAAQSVADAEKQAAEEVQQAEQTYRQDLEQVKGDRIAEARAAQALGQARQDAAQRVADVEQQAAAQVSAAQQTYRQDLAQVRGDQIAYENAQRGVRQANDEVTASFKALELVQASEQRRLGELSNDVQGQKIAQEQLAFQIGEARRALAKDDPGTRQYREDLLNLQSLQNQYRGNALRIKDAEDQLTQSRRRGTSELQSAEDQYTQSRQARQEALQAESEARRQLNQDQRQAARDKRAIDKAEIEGTLAVTRAQQEGNRAVTAALQAQSDTQRQLLIDQRQAGRDRRAIAKAEIEGQRAVAQAQQEANQQVASAERAARRAQQAAKQARKEGTAETVKLTSAEKQLYAAFKQTQKLAGVFLQPAVDSAALLGVKILGLTNRFIPMVSRASNQSVKALSGVFDTFESRLLGSGFEGKFQRFLGGIPPLISKLGNTAATAAPVVADLFFKAVPYGTQLLDVVNSLVRQLTGDLAAASRSGDLDRFLESAWHRAQQLGRVVGNLVGGFSDLFGALSQSGVQNDMMRGLLNLTDGFSHLFDKGTDARHMIQRLGAEALPIFRSVGAITGEVVHQLARISVEALNFRTEGSKLTVVQKIFRAIKDSVKPVADTMIDAFKVLGPELPPLIRNFSKLFETFAGQTPVLKTYLHWLNRLLGWFNDLPKPVQAAVANIVAFSKVASLIGGPSPGSAVASIAAMVLQWRKMNQILKAINQRGIPTAVDPAGIPTAPKTGPSVARVWASRLASLAALAGIITIAVTFDYSGARKQFRDSVKQAHEDGKVTGEEYSDSFADALVQGMQGVPLLGPVFKFLDNNILKPADKKLGNWKPISYWVQTHLLHQKPPAGLGRVGRSLMEAVITGMKAIPVIGPLIQQLDTLAIRGDKKAREMRKVGVTVSERIIDGLKGVPIIGPFLRIFDALFGRSKRKVREQNWKPIGLGAAGEILAGFAGGGLVGGALALIERWFSRSKRKRESQRWKPLGVSAVADILAGFLSGGLIGGTLRIIDRWFSRSKRKSESQRWKPIGVGAVAEILAGFVSGGLIGGAIAVIDRWFGRSKRKRETQRWKPLGASAAGDILKGFGTGGLIGGAIALIESWFSRSKRKQEGQRWKPIGIGAAADILAGFLGGGLIVGAINLITSWFGRSKAKADQHRWKPIGDTAAKDILAGFLGGGLIGGALGLIANWFSRSKDKQASQDWKGIGLGAAAKVVLGFTTGGIPGTVAAVLGNAASKGKDQTPKFENCGKDSARGYVRGFSAIDIAKFLVDKVKGGWDAVAKWGQGHSPWRRTMLMGMDAIKGWAIGLLRDGGLSVRNAKTMAARVAKAIRDGVVDLGDVPKAVWDQLLKRGWVGDPADNRERLSAPGTRGGRNLSAEQRQMENERLEARNAFRLRAMTFQGRTPVRDWDAGSPRDMVSTILNSKAATIGKSWAKYLVYHLNRMPDSFRARRADDIQRLAPRLRSLGFSGFEDGTFVSNTRARQFRRGSAGGGDTRARLASQQQVQEEIRDGIVNLGDVQKKTWDKLLRKGWQGDPRDRAERIYSPSRLRRRGMIQAEDGSFVPPSFFGPGGRGENRRTPQDRLMGLMDKLTKSVYRSDKQATLRLRSEIALTQREQGLIKQRKRADSPDKQIKIMREQAVVAARLGRQAQVDRLKAQIARTEQQRIEDADRRHQRTQSSASERLVRQQAASNRAQQQTAAALPTKLHRTETRPQGGQGSGGITAREFRSALKEHTRDLARLMRAGMADAPNLAAFQRQMDKSLGGYIGFRNGMGAQPQ